MKMLDRVEKIERFAKLAKYAFDGYVKFRSSELRRYQNIEHVMMEESEILIPSTEESYMFDKHVWNVDTTNEYIILTKKRK